MAQKIFSLLLEALNRVYSCEDPATFVSEYMHLKFRFGLRVDLILMVIEWFFIEQDIRDWNYSGRAMFMNGINELGLPSKGV